MLFRSERVSRARGGGRRLGQFGDQPPARARRPGCRTRQEYLPLGVLRALAVASTHYLMDLQRVSSGYVVPDDADADATSAIMDEADAAAEEFATVLAEKLEADIPPIAEFDAPEDPQGGNGSKKLEILGIEAT